VYKSFILRFSAVGSIATTYFLLISQLPLSAHPKSRRPCIDTSPVAQRVALTLKADKKVLDGENVSFQPIVGKSSVKPGDIIKYTVIAKNNSRCPLKNLMLKQPIPKGTAYLKDSATNLNGAELLFSIDGGKTFVARPKVADREAPAETYNYIRWKFPAKITTKSQVTASYKLQVK
jgi:uncharacterized repeat protein (TIGR01451 family)